MTEDERWEIFNQGFDGFWDNEGNPHEIGSDEWHTWEIGWDYAQFNTNQIGEDAIYEKL